MFNQEQETFEFSREDFQSEEDWSEYQEQLEKERLYNIAEDGFY